MNYIKNAINLIAPIGRPIIVNPSPKGDKINMISLKTEYNSNKSGSNFKKTINVFQITYSKILMISNINGIVQSLLKLMFILIRGC